jgi:hypothetical protein
MKNSKIINIQRYKINKNYYTIGLLIGALRAEMENGTVELESVYGLLTDRVKSAIDSDLATAGVVVR